jgi:hypothetical protein
MVGYVHTKVYSLKNFFVMTTGKPFERVSLKEASTMDGIVLSTRRYLAKEEKIVVDELYDESQHSRLYWSLLG